MRRGNPRGEAPRTSACSIAGLRVFTQMYVQHAELKDSGAVDRVLMAAFPVWSLRSVEVGAPGDSTVFAAMARTASRGRLLCPCWRRSPARTACPPSPPPARRRRRLPGRAPPCRRVLHRREDRHSGVRPAGPGVAAVAGPGRAPRVRVGNYILVYPEGESR